MSTRETEVGDVLVDRAGGRGGRLRAGLVDQRPRQGRRSPIDPNTDPGVIAGKNKAYRNQVRGSFGPYTQSLARTLGGARRRGR